MIFVRAVVDGWIAPIRLGGQTSVVTLSRRAPDILPTGWRWWGLVSSMSAMAPRSEETGKMRLADGAEAANPGSAPSRALGRRADLGVLGAERGKRNNGCNQRRDYRLRDGQRHNAAPRNCQPKKLKSLIDKNGRAQKGLQRPRRSRQCSRYAQRSANSPKPGAFQANTLKTPGDKSGELGTVSCELEGRPARTISTWKSLGRFLAGTIFPTPPVPRIDRRGNGQT